MNQKKEKKPVLSISFLSSGRQKTIKKCLDSLLPIMEAISCELIIVDTGCGEEVAALLREYTEHIIPFTWCSDFSKARNVGLEAATGEWFLYLDDDEWFEDASEIISFFKTGEYKNYACACYIQRNYLDYTEEKWSDAWVSRIARLDEGLRFVSSIHEYLYPLENKCKLLHDYVKHFGYVYDSEEEKQAHSKRNVTNLLDMIEKEPSHIRWWAHLAQEYFSMQEFDKLRKLCTDGLQQFEKISSEEVNCYRATLYLGLLMIYLSEHDNASAETLYKNAIADGRNTDMCRAMLQARIAELYYEQERYNECASCCEKYMKIYEMLKDDEAAYFMQNAFFTVDVFQPQVRNNVYCFYIKCCVNRQDVDGFISAFYKIGWEKEKLVAYHTLESDVLEGFYKLPYRDEFVRMAEVMLKRMGTAQIVIDRLQEIEDVAVGQMEADGLQEVENPDAKRFSILCNVFSKVKNTQFYIDYIKLLGMAEDKEAFYEALTTLFKQYTEKLPDINMAMTALEQGDVKKAGEAWKQCIALCPQLAGPVKRYMKLYADRQRACDSRQPVNSELLQLAEQVKGQIKLLLSQNMYTDAENVLKQLRTLVPEDEEMRLLGHKIMEKNVFFSQKNEN